MEFQLIAFFGLLSLAPTVMALNDWRVWYLLWRYGETMEAQIQYHWEAPIGLFKHYYVIYEFEVPDENGDFLLQSRYTEVERAQYFALLEGEPLQVRFASKNPRVFRLEGQPTAQWHWTFGSIACWAYVGFMGYIMITN